jgi:hypothetical protein
LLSKKAATTDMVTIGQYRTRNGRISLASMVPD